jgi:hypothetical protein
MIRYNNYSISEGDTFHSPDYPKAVRELEVMNQGTAHLQANAKGINIVSYLKDHCLNSKWVKDNPTLAGLITSKVFPTAHLESLFDSCRNNKGFLKAYEEYIMNEIFLKKFKSISEQ